MLAVLVVLTLAVIGAVFFAVPPAEGLGYYVRLAFFHIPVAWVSVLAFLVSAFFGAKYLKEPKDLYDRYSANSAGLGLVFVILATLSGAVFSKLTWGAYWNVLLLIYGAYLTLRAAMPDKQRRARVSAVYALLSFLTVPFLVFIIPRLYFSLHPSPVINGSGHIDMDPVMLWTLIAALVDMTGIYCYLLHRWVKKAGSGQESEALHE